MSKRVFSLVTVLMLLLAVSAGAQPSSKFDDLEKYLNQMMVGPEAVRVIKEHLERSGTTTPLEELISWTKAGFPDMHDERGYWKTESLSLRLGVARSLHYYFSTSPPADKATRYLAAFEELQADDYITYHLAGGAHLIVDEVVLEEKVLKLLGDKDPKRRALGVWMGHPLAEQKQYWFERYHQMLKSDEDVHVKLTILSTILAWIKRRDVAFIAFERLLNESNADVRDLAARGLGNAARRGVLTQDDLSTILPAMLKTSNPVVRVSLACSAAHVTTDKSLVVMCNKFTDELLAGFINSAKASQSTAATTLNEAELPKLWIEWWTPLIPTHTTRLRRLH
ncbi:MAG TPA: hypothetical protein VF074_21105 [Pyrinomonadaceae bacterium]